MGFDMSLSKKVYIGANYNFNKVTGIIELKRNNVTIPINLDKVEYILEKQAEWLNADHIHNWFDTNIENDIDSNAKYEISGEKLIELVDLCQQVLANHNLANELLPLYDSPVIYGKNYFRDLENTIEQLKDIDPDCYYEYQVWW